MVILRVFSFEHLIAFLACIHLGGGNGEVVGGHGGRLVGGHGVRLVGGHGGRLVGGHGGRGGRGGRRKYYHRIWRVSHLVRESLGAYAGFKVHHVRDRIVVYLVIRVRDLKRE